MVTRFNQFRSLPRRVYVTPLCKSPRSKKMWVKPEGNPEMVLEKETLEISYDHMPAPSMRVMDFCTNLLTIDSPPPKKRLKHPGEANPRPYTSRSKLHRMWIVLWIVLYHPGQLCRLKKLCSWETCNF